MAELSEQKKAIVLDVHAMPWEERPAGNAGKTNFRKMLIDDPDTKMCVRLMRYPAGYTTAWHVHPCAHGMYVLQGTLKTDEGLYGPGHFVWFPEGTVAEHGATDESDVLALFITNKEFGIRYVEKQ